MPPLFTLLIRGKRLEGKMRRIWIGALLLLLIAVFASHSATGYFNASELNSNSTFSTASNWPELLRPDGVGNSTQNTPNGAAENWQCIAEGAPDEDSTYVQCDATSYLTDIYSTQDHSVGSGTISKVTVNIRCRKVKSYLDQTVYAKSVLRTYATNYEGAEVNLPDGYAVYSTEYTLNPNTSNSWTWDEVDALEGGVSLKSAQSDAWDYARCTQVWVAVYYTP
jgi:hypothetical protein